jgi:hypothetical protein
MAFLALVDQQPFGVVTTGTVNGRRENEPTALGSGEPLHHIVDPQGLQWQSALNAMLRFLLVEMSLVHIDYIPRQIITK